MITWTKAQIQKLENKLHRYTLGQSSRLKKLYLESYEDVIREIERLAFRGDLSRSEIYRLQKLESVLEQLEIKIEKEMTSCLEKVVRKAATELGWTTINDDQVKFIVDQGFHGQTYSERVWGNTQKLKQRVYNDMRRLVTTGGSPEKMKAAIMKDFNVGYREADKLIRTESSRVFNQSSLARYRDAGVNKVIILGSHDERLCEECGQVTDKVYDIDHIPVLPIHPNCRCCYAPYI